MRAGSTFRQNRFQLALRGNLDSVLRFKGDAPAASLPDRHALALHPEEIGSGRGRAKVLFKVGVGHGQDGFCHRCSGCVNACLFSLSL